MSLLLRARHGKTGEEVEFRLAGRSYVLGRPSSADSSNKLAVGFDATLSRQHARLDIAGEKVTVTRVQAKHPLVFRGRAQETFVLVAGDSFQSGATTFQLDREGELTLTESYDFTAEVLNLAKETHARAIVEALLELQPVLSEWKDTAALFSALLPILARIVSAASALLAIRVLPDGSQQGLCSYGGRGRVLQPSQTLLRNCLNTNTAVCHVWEEGCSGGLEPTAMGGVSWALAAPVAAFPDSYVLYAVGAEVRARAPAVGDMDLAVLALVCSFVGKHFEGRRVTELAMQVEAERSQRILSDNLYQLNRVLTSTLDVRAVLDRLLWYLHPVVPFERGYALVREQSAYQLYARRGVADSEGSLTLHGSHPFLYELSRRQSLLLPGSDPLLSSFPLAGFAHCLALQPTYGGEPRGLILLARAQPFSEHDAGVANTFTQQVGVALENARLYSRVRAQAITDELTGLYNRRSILSLGRERWSAAQASGAHFSAILFDIDHFKTFNDSHGQEVGDQALRTLAQVCRRELRSSELLGRLGGKKFLALSERDLSQAQSLAERLRQAIAQAEVASPGGPLRLSVSLGVAGREVGVATWEDLLKSCDQALGQAKAQGRNQVCVPPL